MPPETPAADNAAAIERRRRSLSMERAGSRAPRLTEKRRPRRSPQPTRRRWRPTIRWERFNRFNYRFNARFDEAVFLPVSNAYRRLPSPIRAGVHNFFGNLSEIDSVINYTLQGRLGRGVRSLGRFVINSTLGIGGLFDVATKFHLPNAPTGFGTTLCQWGMHPGPYLVIPFLGPSTLREAVGLLGDYRHLVWHQHRESVSRRPVMGIGRGQCGRYARQRQFPLLLDAARLSNTRISAFLYVRKLLLEDEGLHQKIPRQRPPADVPAGQ